jgi:hypothetical protein
MNEVLQPCTECPPEEALEYFSDLECAPPRWSNIAAHVAGCVRCSRRKAEISFKFLHPNKVLGGKYRLLICLARSGKTALWVAERGRFEVAIVVAAPQLGMSYRFQSSDEGLDVPSGLYFRVPCEFAPFRGEFAGWLARAMQPPRASRRRARTLLSLIRWVLRQRAAPHQDSRKFGEFHR